MTMAEPDHILLVDDDPRLRMLLADKLRRDGFEVTLAATGRQALTAFDDRWPDLVVLDLMMPDMDGEAVAEQMKRRADIPIVVLSAVNEAESKVELIQRYAEDYITKPFYYSELLARIQRVLLRLNERIPGQEVQLGPDLSLVLKRRKARVGDRWVGLSPIETRLLATLAAHMGESLSTNQILARVWGNADGADPAYVWVTMRRLRQKLEGNPDEPRHLVSTKGGGYTLVVDPPPP